MREVAPKLKARWVLVSLAVGALLAWADARAQNRPVQPRNQVPCHYVPNGDAVTIACVNGFWQTILPDGTIIEGNGMPDPNATANGSNIVIDGATGGPNIKGGQTVQPPTQVIPTPAPGQSYWYGLPPPQQ